MIAAPARIAVRVLKSWREIEDFVVPSAASRLSRSTVERLVELGFLQLLAKGPAGEVRVSAAALDAAWDACDDARSRARERFGRHRRGGLSDRLAQIAYAELHPTSLPARKARAAAARAQLALFGEPANDDDEEEK